MCRTIIFDFNRTLYNPEVDRLMPQTKRVLSVLLRRGCRLYLISRKEGEREERIRSLGLAPYFNQILVVPQKSKAVFSQLLRNTDEPAERILVVGDRLSDEILIANRLGCTSVRLKAGKFANESPANAYQVPRYTIRSLPELLPLVR